MRQPGDRTRRHLAGIRGTAEEWLRTSRPLGVPVELLGALVVGSVLRLFRLGSESFWIDETYSVVVASESTVRAILFVLPQIDPHPPLYYLLLRGWYVLGTAGTSEFAMRLPSVVFGVAAIPLLYLLASDLFDRWTAGTAALFFAVAPFQIWYAQEVRMYTLLVLLGVAAWLLLRRLSREPSRRLTVGYVATAALLGYTHVFGLFAVLAQCLFLLWSSRADPRCPVTIRRLLGVYAAVGALLSPWLATLATRVLSPTAGTASQTAWITDPEPGVLWDTFTLFVFGYADRELYWSLDAPPTLLVVVALVVLATLLAGRVFHGSAIRGPEIRPGDEPSGFVLVFLWLVVPVVVPYVLSWLVTPIYIYRYTIVAAPAMLLLLARGVRSVAYVEARYVLAAVLLAGMVVPLPGYYADDQKDQWRSVGESITDDADAGDVVLVYPAWTDRSLSLYFDRTDVPVVPVLHDATSGDVEGRIDDAGDGDVYVVLSHTSEAERERVRTLVTDATGVDPVERRSFVNVEVYVYRR